MRLARDDALAEGFECGHCATGLVGLGAVVRLDLTQVVHGVLHRAARLAFIRGYEGYEGV